MTEAEEEDFVLSEQKKTLFSLIAGLRVKEVLSLKERELVIEFEDGTRLFIDSKTAIELSVT